MNTGLPVISGTVQEGDTLMASTGVWTNNPASFSYHWQDCSPSCSNITGATGSSYVLQASDVGDTIDVVVTATNAGGSANATSLGTVVVVAASGSDTPPAGVSLQAIVGDSLNANNTENGYYCSAAFGTTVAPASNNACLDGWDGSSFFPIGPYWGNYVGEQSTWTALDWNTEWYTTSQSDVNALTSAGLFSVPAANVSPTSNVVGYDSHDEPGTWSAATSALASTPNSTQDGRFWMTGNDWDQFVTGPPTGTPGNTMSAFFSDMVTTPNGTARHLDVEDDDLYWFSLANSGLCSRGECSMSQGGQIYKVGGSLTQAEAECGCRYGDMIGPVPGTTVGFPSGDSMSSWHDSPSYIPIEDSAQPQTSPVGNTPTPPELNWAAWSSVIHGVRGIIWFDHSFGSGCVSDNFVTSSCAKSPYSGQSVSVAQQITTTDGQIESIASEINSPVALGYETVSPAPTTFGGIETRAVFDTHPADCNGQASCFYILAGTRDAETTTNIAATYTLAGTYSGPIPVATQCGTGPTTTGTVTDSTNQITDTFPTAACTKIYGPIPNQ